MCEMFGITADKEVVANPLLESFYQHSSENRDGWGLAVFRGHSVTMEKEPRMAAQSTYLRQRLSRDIRCRNLFAHIRKATIGRIEYANCHPFIWDDNSGRTWTLMHNGTIFEPDSMERPSVEPEGTTDSERILLYIIDQVNKEIVRLGRDLDSSERFRLLDTLVTRISKGNKLNLLIYDGENMYVHTNCPGTLHEWTDDHMTLFATKPFRMDGWQPLTMNRLLAYRDGVRIETGTDHGNTFEDNKDMTMLYFAYSEL